MIPMRAFRTDLHFADLFAHVPVFCWPKLWWQINALLARSIRQGVVGLFYSVNDRGFTTLRHAGEAPHPETNKPLARPFLPLTDASWGSHVPSDLNARSRSETTYPAPILACVSGGRWHPAQQDVGGGTSLTPQQIQATLPLIPAFAGMSGK